MKKFSCFLIAVLALAFTACGGNGEPTEPNSNEPVHIDVVAEDNDLPAPPAENGREETEQTEYTLSVDFARVMQDLMSDIRINYEVFIDFTTQKYGGESLQASLREFTTAELEPLTDSIWILSFTTGSRTINSLTIRTLQRVADYSVEIAEFGGLPLDYFYMLRAVQEGNRVLRDVVARQGEFLVPTGESVDGLQSLDIDLRGWREAKLDAIAEAQSLLNAAGETP